MAIERSHTPAFAPLPPSVSGSAQTGEPSVQRTHPRNSSGQAVFQSSRSVVPLRLQPSNGGRRGHPPSAKLRSLANSLLEQRQFSPHMSETEINALTLRLSTRQMELEGHYLNELQGQGEPAIPYENLATHLHPELRMPTAALGVNSPLESLRSHLAGMREQIEHNELPDAEDVDQLVNDLMPQLTRHLAGSAALYREVLGQPNLAAHSEAVIKVSHKAFIGHAVEAEKTLLEELGHCLKALDTQIGLQKQWLNADDENQAILPRLAPLPINAEPSSGREVPDEHAARTLQTAEWATLHTRLADALKSTKAGPLRDAVDNAKRPKTLENYRAANSGVWPKVTSALGAMGPQILGSAASFGAARSSLEVLMGDYGLMAKAAVVGAGLGLSHELAVNSIRPLAQILANSIGLNPLRAIDKTEVLPNATSVISENGLLRIANDPQEVAALQKDIEELRQVFSFAQQDHKPGTAKGEAEGYLAFGTAQLVLKATKLVQGIGEKTGFSAGGGALMALMHTLGQYLKTVPDADGKPIPTHTPAPATKPLKERLEKFGKEFKTSLDLSDDETLNRYLGKMFGSMQGLAIAYAIAERTSLMDSDSKAHVAAQLAFALLSSSELLTSFFPNMQASKEAKKGKTDEFTNAILNIQNPDRESVLHTTLPNTTSRTAENLYFRGRGVLQAGPQAATLLTSALIHVGVEAASSAKTHLPGAIQSAAHSTRQNADAIWQAARAGAVGVTNAALRRDPRRANDLEANRQSLDPDHELADLARPELAHITTAPALHPDGQDD